jgi:hypothetical protein
MCDRRVSETRSVGICLCEGELWRETSITNLAIRRILGFFGYARICERRLAGFVIICCIEEVEEGACVWKEVEELLITTQQRQARAATQDRKEHLDY